MLRCARDTHKAGGHSCCTPDDFTIAGQRLISSARNSPYCRVDQFCGSKPSLAILAMSSGDRSAALNAPLSCSTIGGGVPAVFSTPAEKVSDNCGRPISAMVGTSAFDRIIVELRVERG